MSGGYLISTYQRQSALGDQRAMLLTVSDLSSLEPSSAIAACVFLHNKCIEHDLPDSGTPPDLPLAQGKLRKVCRMCMSMSTLSNTLPQETDVHKHDALADVVTCLNEHQTLAYKLCMMASHRLETTGKLQHIGQCATTFLLYW